MQFPQLFDYIDDIEWLHGKELTAVEYTEAGHIVCLDTTIAVIQKVVGLELQVTFYTVAASHLRFKLERE